MMLTAVIAKTPSAHHEHSPSSSATWMGCAAAIRAQRGIPDSTSAAAEEGSAQHELNAWAVAEDRAPEERLGLTFPDYPDYPVTRENVDCCLQWIEYIKSLELDHIWVESRVDFSHLIPDGFGHSDLVGVKGTTAHVLDYKHGQGVAVDVQTTSQLPIYAAGVVRELGCIHDIEEIVLHIVQPRLGIFASRTMTPGELEAFEEDVVRAYQLSLEPDAAFTPGEKQCQWCRAKNVCAARAEFVFKQATDGFLTIDQLEPEEALDTINPDHLTPAQVAAALPHLATIKHWVSSMEKHAVTELAAGREIPGYKLVRGRSNRRWKDPERAITALRGAGLRVKDICEQKLVGIPAIEKLLGKGHPVFGDLVEKPVGSPTLAPVSDKRPALEDQSTSAFTQLTQETES